MKIQMIMNMHFDTNDPTKALRHWADSMQFLFNLEGFPGAEVGKIRSWKHSESTDLAGFCKGTIDISAEKGE